MLISSDIGAVPCPLCGSAGCSAYHRDKRRDYLHCPACGLVFVPESQLLSEQDEHARYDLHRNAPDDPGYRDFLHRLFLPMQARSKPGSRGLDFGSGPEPALAVLFERAGYAMTLYDRYYADDRTALERQYDFITACEVLEHIRDPKQELDRLWRCLEPGGTFGVMTKLLIERDAFGAWYYKNDPTHIRFYGKQTFDWLAELWQAEITLAENDVILLRKT